MQSDQSSCFTIYDKYNRCGPCKQGRWHRGCRFDPKLGGDEGCTSKSGSGIVFPPPCPCLAFTLERSRNITHAPSADPHIAHSCLNKREVEMEEMDTKTSRKRDIGYVWWDGIRNEVSNTLNNWKALCTYEHSDPAGIYSMCPHGEIIFRGGREHLLSWIYYILSLQWLESGGDTRSRASTPGKVKVSWGSTCYWWLKTKTCCYRRTTSKGISWALDRRQISMCVEATDVTAG